MTLRAPQRLSPAVSTVFRVARNDVEYNESLIPKGEMICWNLNNGYKAESLYSQPAKRDNKHDQPISVESSPI